MSRDMKDTLVRSVRAVVQSESAQPRPGQAALANDIQASLDSSGHVCGIAPTGLGKSMALLAPAMAAAARNGKRTLISTDALSLMDQVHDKDSPVVAQATQDSVGTRPTYATLKGFSNYLCLSKVQQAADLIIDDGAPLDPTRARAVLARASRKGSVQAGYGKLERGELIDTVDWALTQRSGQLPGDIHTYPGEASPKAWKLLTTNSARCAGPKCPFFDECMPIKAKETAGKADIVIVNHSMMAVQAATGAPVVIGNKVLGDFDAIMVDEAHTLPSKVRDQGAVTMGPGQVIKAGALAAESLPRTLMAEGLRITKEAEFVAEHIRTVLAGVAEGLKPGETKRLAAGEDPLADATDAIVMWVKNTGEFVNRNQETSVSGFAAIDALDELSVSAKATADKGGDLTARWVQLNGFTGYPEFASSPIDVGPMLFANLWTKPAEVDEDEIPDPEVRRMREEAGEDPDEEPRIPLSVTCVSGTLPNGFARSAGLDCETKTYPSPFKDAYQNCVLYVPSTDAQDIAELYPGWRPGTKARFDTMLHRAWVSRKAAELVEANGGSAIILCATGDNGKAYAAALRKAARGRWKVYSQWDGPSQKRLIAAWRADTTSVLVGAKSMMTGTDASGKTCSLVIVDRVPRAASNPVDDALAENLVARVGMDRFAADRLIYAVNASLLLEQSLGRLVRSVTDRGTAAVLDPRMLLGGPASYPEPTRAIYKGAMKAFPHVLTRHDEALAFIRKTARSW